MTGRAPDTTDDQSPDRSPGIPRWAKLLAIGAVVGIAAMVVAMLLVGGEHGPGMHGG